MKGATAAIASESSVTYAVETMSWLMTLVVWSWNGATGVTAGVVTAAELGFRRAVSIPPFEPTSRQMAIARGGSAGAEPPYSPGSSSSSIPSHHSARVTSTASNGSARTVSSAPWTPSCSHLP